MSKKIMMLAAMAVTAVMLAVPAMAAALVPVHVVPKPTAASTVTGATATLSTVGGSKVVCKEVTGSTTWESGTTGLMNLTFKNDCTATVGFTVSCSEIKVANAPFHLVTVGAKPGVLVTPPAGGVFAKFTCAGVFTFEVKGTGVVGTVTSPECGKESATATVKFEGAAGVQKHKKVDGTETDYHLTSNGEEAAQEATGTLAFTEGAKKLECT